MLSTTLAALVFATTSVLAHPFHVLTDAEISARDNFQYSARRALSQCSNSLKRDGLAQRSVERRMAMLERARREKYAARAKKKRDFDEVLNTNHHSNLTGLTNDTDPSVFLTNPSCVLGTEVTEGPYYVASELIRYDVRSGQEGIDLYLDYELIDVSTCNPVSDVWVDFWHANATGVYSAVVANGNGDSSDESNLKDDHGRGIQATNDEGVVQFLSLVPGHYIGRAPHIHVMANSNGTVFDNGTFFADTVMHVGQLFFDQDLITAVNEVEPYASNTQELTLNADDSIMSQESADIDPVVQYVYLTDDISDGIFAWASMGIDLTNSHTVSAAATWTEDGAVLNANSGAPGGGGMGPSGSMSGIPPDATGSMSMPPPDASASAV
ncbi:aromatic compound dioxygenase [Flagelloscypha sp. PMI_526]|nr:aromatic compound dioxygenase [Flagelloscypha sp. PMI_526]